MMGDCFNDLTDILVLVSADSDLIPPLDFILHNFKNKKFKVYFPPSNNSFDINNYMKAHKSSVVRLDANATKFKNSIMPDTVAAGNKNYTIPDKWK